MKKKLFLSLCLIGLLIFVGCSNDKDDKKVTQPTNEKNNIIENEPVKSNEVENTKFYIGSWKINKYIWAGIGIYSKDEVESFIGKTVVFSDETANYFEEQFSDKMNILKNPIYKESDMSVEEYLDGYKLTNDIVGLNGSMVKQIDIMDGNENYLLSLIKDDNRLFIHLPGVFLELEKSN
ncbi:MAG: hypothetical protein ACERKV_04215 [Clostridiaceae bacterium]